MQKSTSNATCQLEGYGEGVPDAALAADYASRHPLACAMQDSFPAGWARLCRAGVEPAQCDRRGSRLAIVLRPWEYRFQRRRSSARMRPAIGASVLYRCGERAILKPAFAKLRSGPRPPRPLARRSLASGDVHDPPRQTRYEHSGSTHALPSAGAPK